MGRNQGQFHFRRCTFAEVGTWGGRHFSCCPVILGTACITSTVTLDPAAATLAATATTWETSYCWKVAVLRVHLCNISWWFKVLSGALVWLSLGNCLYPSCRGSIWPFWLIREEADSHSHRYSHSGEISKHKHRERDRRKCQTSKQNKLKLLTGFFILINTCLLILYTKNICTSFALLGYGSLALQS